jgi:TPR repeat protein
MTRLIILRRGIHLLSYGRTNAVLKKYLGDANVSLLVSQNHAMSSQRLPKQHLYSSVTSDTAIHAQDNADRLYQSYMKALEDSKLFHQEQERTKSEQMFQAWQRAEGRASDGSARRNNTGVAVVRTLVKETHKEKSRLEAKYAALKERAHSFLVQAAKHGHSQAMVQLGSQELERAHLAWEERHLVKTRQALEQAMEWYRRSQSPEGWFNLGSLLWTGYPDQSDDDPGSIDMIALPKDAALSMEAFKKAIELDDADAMYFVGVIDLGQLDEDDEQGTTVPREETLLESLRQGLNLIERAASRGHGGALYYLALLHLNGHQVLGIPPCSSSQFKTRLDAAAECHNVDALFMRGHCFYNGADGYPRDVCKALEDFLLAADEGNADAAVSAGAILFNGHPPTIPRNQERAFSLYQLAGELGSPEGWRNVVACYLSGEGVGRNEQIAKYIAETMLKEENNDNMHD